MTGEVLSVRCLVHTEMTGEVLSVRCLVHTEMTGTYFLYGD